MPSNPNPDTGVVTLEKTDQYGRKTLREYTTVPLRIQKFWEDQKHEGWSILTKLIHCDEETVRIRARIYNKEGVPVASGHAEEIRGSTDVNTTSALENCETSAVGRALGNLGYAGTQFASAEEVTKAVAQQTRFQKVREHFLPIFKDIAKGGMAHLQECWEAPMQCTDPGIEIDGQKLTAIEVKRALKGELPTLKQLAGEADLAAHVNAQTPGDDEKPPWET